MNDLIINNSYISNYNNPIASEISLQWDFNFDFSLDNIIKYKKCSICGKTTNLFKCKNKITLIEIPVCYDCFVNNNFNIVINGMKLKDKEKEYYLEFFKRHYFIERDDSIERVNNLIELLNKDSSFKKIENINSNSFGITFSFIKMIQKNKIIRLKSYLTFDEIDNIINLSKKIKNIKILMKITENKKKNLSLISSLFLYIPINDIYNYLIDTSFYSIFFSSNNKKYYKKIKEYVSQMKIINQLFYLLKNIFPKEDKKFIVDKLSNKETSVFYYNKEKDKFCINFKSIYLQ